MKTPELDLFATLLRWPNPPLDRCALLFARLLVYPDLDIDANLTRLDDVAHEADHHLPQTLSQTARATALAQFLFQGETAFKGNAADYDNPRNSFLNDVLDRRRGIPISLALLFITVARRLHIHVDGIGLPGHFVVAVHDPDGVDKLLLDPFHKGQRLSRSDCARLVARTTGYQGEFYPQWLAPTPPPLMIARMLNNLRLAYFRREAWPQAGRAIQLLRIVQPDVHEHLRDQGLVAFQEKQYRSAATLLEEYLELLPEAADKEAIRQGIADALDRWVMLN